MKIYLVLVLVYIMLCITLLYGNNIDYNEYKINIGTEYTGLSRIDKNNSYFFYGNGLDSAQIFIWNSISNEIVDSISYRDIDFPNFTSIKSWKPFNDKFIYATDKGLIVYSKQSGTEVYDESNFDLIYEEINSLSYSPKRVIATNNTSSILCYEDDSLRRVYLGSNFDSIPPYKADIHNLAQIDDKFFYNTHDGTFCYYDFALDKVFVYWHDSFEGEDEETFNISCITSYKNKIYILTDEGRLHIWEDGNISYVTQLENLLKGETLIGDLLSYSYIFVDWLGRLWIYITDLEDKGYYGRILNRFMFTLDDDFELINKINANEEFGDGLTVASMSYPHKNISDTSDYRVFFHAEGKDYFFGKETSVETQTEIFNKMYLDKMYPNPCSDFLNLEIMLNPHKKDDVSIAILNYLGQVVSEPVCESSYNNSTGYLKVLVELNDAPKGYYFLMVDNGTDKDLRPIIIE